MITLEDAEALEEDLVFDAFILDAQVDGSQRPEEDVKVIGLVESLSDVVQCFKITL